MNPFDMYAIEEGLCRKKTWRNSDRGFHRYPWQRYAEIAIGMGADEAVLSDRRLAGLIHTTSYALAKTCEKLDMT